MQWHALQVSMCCTQITMVYWSIAATSSTAVWLNGPVNGGMCLDCISVTIGWLLSVIQAESGRVALDHEYLSNPLHYVVGLLFWLLTEWPGQLTDQPLECSLLCPPAQVVIPPVPVDHSVFIQFLYSTFSSQSVVILVVVVNHSVPIQYIQSLWISLDAKPQDVLWALGRSRGHEGQCSAV